jgi:hypothetical protein
MPHRPDPLPPPFRPDPVAAASLADIHPSPVLSAIDEVEIAGATRSFADYWVTARKSFAEPDAQGVRVFKARQYVPVSDGQFVQVVRDAESNLFRATVARELNASGPLMEPDVEGRFWRPVARLGHLQEKDNAPPGPSRAIDERLVALYPGMTEKARAALRRERLSGDPLRALARLETEYRTLVKDLDAWAEQVPSLHPVTGLPLTSTEVVAQRTIRERFAQELRSNWSRQTTHANPYTPTTLNYDLDVLGSLPRLSADFSHVRELGLSSAYALEGSDFLASFPGVRYLTLSGFALKSFPVEVYQMRELVTLTLDKCEIRLTEATVEGLAHIEALTLLDLSNNPLGLPPDIRYMRHLDSLYLSNTELGEVPAGLFEIESLAFADLSDNEITSLPDELFEVPDVQQINYNFRNNPLDEAALQRVSAYIQGAGLDRKVMIQVDGEVQMEPQILVSESEDSGMESS